jgi:RsiW-degrading membrane proteinase PrsW (M82 family)
MKKTLKQSFSIRETIDIAFLLLSFIFLLIFYWFAFDIFYPNRPGQSADSRNALGLILLGGCLLFSLVANIIVQTIFNIEKTTIKTKAYTFFFISMIDIVYS